MSSELFVLDDKAKYVNLQALGVPLVGDLAGRARSAGGRASPAVKEMSARSKSGRIIIVFELTPGHRTGRTWEKERQKSRRCRQWSRWRTEQKRPRWK